MPLPSNNKRFESGDLSGYVSSGLVTAERFFRDDEYGDHESIEETQQHHDAPEVMMVSGDSTHAPRVIHESVVALEQPLMYNRFGSINPYSKLLTPEPEHEEVAHEEAGHEAEVQGAEITASVETALNDWPKTRDASFVIQGLTLGTEPFEALTAKLDGVQPGCHLYRADPAQFFLGGVWGPFVVEPNDGSELDCRPQ